MSDPIFQQLNQYFINRNFDQIPTDSQAVSMYGTFEHSHLYLINIISLEDGYELDLERYLEYKQLTMEQFAKNDADKIILLNIIITDQLDHIYDTINFTPDLSEDFIDVIWLIDKTEPSLVIPKKQLKNILRIEKDLKKIFRNESVSYYDLKARESAPITTFVLMALNIVVWLLLEWFGDSTSGDTLLKAGAMQYQLVVNYGEYYRMFTAMFLHIGFLHLFYNMFSLYIFGYRLEKFLNPVKLTIVYILSGIFGSLTSLFGAAFIGVFPVSAGASGAVYGLMGSLLFVSIKRRKPIDGVTTYVLWLLFVLGIVYSVMMPNVDILAHIGGFVSGLAITPLMLKPNKRSSLD